MSQPNTVSRRDALGDLLFVFDGEGAALEWNDAAAEATGYSDGELAAMSRADLFEGEDAERVTDAVGEALAAGTAAVEADLVTAAGDRIPCEFGVHRLSGDGGAATLLAGVDVGRGAAERADAERERREILSRMPDAFLAVDAEWRVTYVNEQGAEILSAAIGRERTPDELQGVDLWESLSDAGESAFRERYRQAMTTQEPVTFEEYYEPLETWFDVRAFPSETGLSVHFYDATELRRQRDALEHRERVIREMHDVMADRRRPFADQVEALLELGRTELDTAYGTLSEIRGDEYHFEVVDADDDALRSGDVAPLSATNCEVAASTERTLVLGDIARDAPGETDRAGYTEWGISCYIGAPVFVDDGVYGTFCFYDTEPRDGQFSEWEVTLVDFMSRWVSYELQHRQAKERLRRQNEKLDRFASIVSHDLRNPLTVLEGRLALAEETGDPEQFRRCYAAVERMDALVDDVLTLARTGDAIGETADVDLGALAEQCWRSVATTDAALAVETERTVRADEARLRQLLENLVRNAVEHGGETVTVTVGDLEDGFYVEDDGPGIPEESRDGVFESGYSTASEGTGFGLAIVEEIAAAHDWSVRATRGAEGGARFEFTDVTLAE